MSIKRIAIIGGGPSGLSTALHLTNEPGWQSKYDICIYQLGWRLGGKGATGRDPKHGWRIEEHGIHGFCKFYFNTWPMMQTTYRELNDANRAVLPCKRIDKAFLPSSLTYLVTNENKAWHSCTDHLPGGEGAPWGPGKVELSWKAIVVGLIDQMLARGRTGDPARLQHKDLIHPEAENDSEHPSLIHKAIKALRTKILSANWDELDDEAVGKLLTGAVKDLESLRKHLGGFFKFLTKTFNIGHSQTLTTLDLYWAVLVGIVTDELWRNDLDVVDHLDFREWLGSHGANDHTLNSPLAMTVANILFAYPQGDSTQPPQLSAASWLNWFLRSAVGKGAYFYFMASGTGDTVISPLYLVLKQRGVRFEFFHKLMDIETSKAKDGLSVEKLIFEKQAQPKRNYDPLVKMPAPKGWKVWPNEPRWSLLEHGKEDQANGINFESWSGPSGAGATTRVLSRGAAGDDGFDYAVWAMPTSIIPLVGDDAMQKAWAPVVQKLTTTMTQSVQFWLTRTTPEMGWPLPKGDPKTARYASATLPNPLNGMTDFSDLIDFENWPADGPKALIYLCSQLQPNGNTHAEDIARVKANHASSLRLFGTFLEDARPSGRAQNTPQEIDFNLLYDPSPGNTGVQRLNYQYHRVNTDPTEAYVQANPGSASARMFPWNCGFTNLVPAGDWIYTGFNIGSFESAVTGGKLAAFALSGKPGIKDIPGFAFLHPDAGVAADKAVADGQVPVVKSVP
jgi:uncharacterized protein with NAD-binding domain and iron-sulfur cluster